MSDTTGDLDDVAARALASIILERTADTLVDNGANAAAALVALEADTGLNLDVCAAVLMATAWLAGAGQIGAEAVFAASIGLDPSEGDGEG